MRRTVVTVLFCTVGLLVAFLVTGCGSSGEGGKSIDPEAIARNYLAAVIAGKADEAKGMMMPGYEYKDELLSKTDQAVVFFNQYEMQNIKVASCRGWRGGASGESDKRIELQFDYRPKGSAAEFEPGVIYLRVTCTGGLWGVTDLEYGVPSG